VLGVGGTAGWCERTARQYVGVPRATVEKVVSDVRKIEAVENRIAFAAL
jgi:hypothetical protein